MLRKFFLIVMFLTVPLFSHALILETDQMSDILTEIEDEEETWVLFDLDQTLIESSFSIGSGAWWKHLRSQPYVSQNLHAHLTHWVAGQVPVRPMEESLPELIQQLQKQGLLVLGLTARGKNEWFRFTIDDVQHLTHRQLSSIGYSLHQTVVPWDFENIDPESSLVPAYGVLFTSHVPKGIFLKDFLEAIQYTPKKIVFVDDKMDQVRSVEEALEALNIPFVGVRYSRCDQDFKEFQPHIATLQLKALIEEGYLISDEEALQRSMNYSNTEMEMLLQKLVEDFQYSRF